MFVNHKRFHVAFPRVGLGNESCRRREPFPKGGSRRGESAAPRMERADPKSVFGSRNRGRCQTLTVNSVFRRRSISRRARLHQLILRPRFAVASGQANSGNGLGGNRRAVMTPSLPDVGQHLGNLRVVPIEW